MRETAQAEIVSADLWAEYSRLFNASKLARPMNDPAVREAYRRFVAAYNGHTSLTFVNVYEVRV